ncbi:hypothetical protein EJ05DRAFT_498181 [Pseudovirgaria hyperparasitica]|uniref:Uncharacterized protein n=1 Tax=Pseudovirgaria hyperparasitica TaxID=470096 RepID=A0A6A6WDS7_9PEZI|nr:uncharacterized protein EJ05DRAFT_498181 [Pseudovirgaria hyperparasitica]KAF2760214.1 hypothetical protein EJ05DRAFT_498181 [Pseudovirgaria hyperparasitica]
MNVFLSGILLSEMFKEWQYTGIITHCRFLYHKVITLFDYESEVTCDQGENALFPGFIAADLSTMTLLEHIFPKILRGLLPNSTHAPWIARMIRRMSVWIIDSTRYVLVHENHTLYSRELQLLL